MEHSQPSPVPEGDNLLGKEVKNKNPGAQGCPGHIEDVGMGRLLLEFRGLEHRFHLWEKNVCLFAMCGKNMCAGTMDFDLQ